MSWHPPTLETNRLLLREVKQSDNEAIYAYAKIPEVSKYTLWEPHQTMNDSDTFIQSYVFDSYKEGEPEPFAICLKEKPDTLIGTVGCFWVSKSNQIMELAYALNPEFWGKGIIAEASQAVIDYAFRVFKVAKIQCRCKEENVSSYRVMEKLKMKYEGTLRNQTYHRNKFWNMKYYSLLLDEWIGVERSKRSTFVRRAKTGDEREIHDAHMKSISEICSHHYNPEQIAAWGGREYCYDSRDKAIRNDHVWVVERNGKIEGYGHLLLDKERGHAEVMGFYFTPIVKSQGFARVIVYYMKELASANGFNEIVLFSTRTSKRFYEKQNFKQYADDDTYMIGGVPIEGHSMKCLL